MRNITYQNTKKIKKNSISYEIKPENSDSKKPIFCFEEVSLQSRDKNISLIHTKETSHDLLQRIEKLSNLSWDAIKKQDHRNYGIEMIPLSKIKGCTDMKNKLQEKNIEKISVFRVNNKGVSRILGIREGQIFKIYCYDFSGSLYEHGS